MSSPTVNFRLRVRLAWWLKPWLHCLVFVARVSGREIDWEKASRVIARAIRFEVEE